MKVTGYLLREAIRRQELRRDTAAKSFDATLFKFEDEKDKATPDAVAEQFLVAEAAVAKLQTAQARYNLQVIVDIHGEKITLSEAVKRLGGAGRMEKMWREAVSPKQERYSYRDPTERDTGKERAQAQLGSKQLMDRANKASAFAGALRAAIAKGNGAEIEHEVLSLDPKLLTE